MYSNSKEIINEHAELTHTRIYGEIYCPSLMKVFQARQLTLWKKILYYEVSLFSLYLLITSINYIETQ